MKVFLIAGQSNAVGTSPTGGLEGYVFPDVLLWQAGEFTEENEKLQNVWLRGVRPGMATRRGTAASSSASARA